MEKLYENITNNELTDLDKQQLNIMLNMFYNRIQKDQLKMKTIKERLPEPKKEKEPKPVKVIDDSEALKIHKPRGPPRKHTDEENIQIHRDVAKRHYLNNLEKRKRQKKEWALNNKEVLSEKAKYNRLKKKLEKELIIEETY
jgi:hypothetical protein